MRLYITLISILLISYSCNVLKKKQKIEDDIRPTIVEEHIESDSDEAFYIEEFVFEDIVSEKFIVNNTLEKTETHLQPPPKKINNSLSASESELKIFDQTSLDTNSSDGTIAYSVPNEMIVGGKYKITVRISKKNGLETNKTLVYGYRNIKINEENTPSVVTIENIRVEKIMSAQLLSHNNSFEIISLSTESQIVEEESYTEWAWIVQPLIKGENHLKMIVKIKLSNQSEYKDITVFNKKIIVKSNPTLGFKNWMSNYWQWLMSTIIIPILIFFYKNKKENKKENK
jgi:hypothetical protein